MMMRSGPEDYPGSVGRKDLLADKPERHREHIVPDSGLRNSRQRATVSLSTALRIARERQRSKSSRRKIFREDPDRYLDIVDLMKETEKPVVPADQELLR